ALALRNRRPRSTTGGVGETGVELHGPRSADSEEEETEEFRTSRRHSICRRTRSPGLSPTPSVFLKARAACRRGGRAVALYRAGVIAPIRLGGGLFQTLTPGILIRPAPLPPGFGAFPRPTSHRLFTRSQTRRPPGH